MSFSLVIKIVALASTTTAITAPVLLTTMPSNSPAIIDKNLDTYNLRSVSLYETDCFIIETKENEKDKIFACNNKKYYWYSLSENKLTKLEDVKTLGGSQVTSTFIDTDNQKKTKAWTMVDESWKAFSAGISLGIGDISNTNGYCVLTYAMYGEKTGMCLECFATKNRSLGLIKLIPLVESN